MSKLLQNQDTPGEVPLEFDALSALDDGLRQLETPVPSSPVESNIKAELASGTDFDPWYRQIGRRIAWTTPAAITAFLVVNGVLAWQPIPQIPLTDRGPGGHDVTEQHNMDVIVDRACEALAPLPHLFASADGAPTQIQGLNLPRWYTWPKTKISIKPDSNRPSVSGNPKGKVTAK